MRVAVFYGGRSVEHHVSVQSAFNVVENIKKMDGFEVVCIFVDMDGRWFYTGDSVKPQRNKSVSYSFTDCYFIVDGKRLDVDVCFSLIHGNVGEDGKLAGFFETINIPYTGCDLLSSAISMNKKLSKILSARIGVKVLDDIFLNEMEFDLVKIKDDVERIGFPVFVKPNSLGSSVGVSKVKNHSELEAAIRKAFKYEKEILIEKAIEKAREIVVGVIGDGFNNFISQCGEVCVKGNHEFYDYSAKYLDDNGMELKIPSPLSLTLSENIKKMAERVFKAVRGYGFSRVDFLMDPLTQEFYFCEINTIPGFTSHSLFPRLFENSGLSIQKQIEMIIELAFKRHSNKNKLSYEI
ncbi:MAG: D-alanine--D-alanine ligase family protein [Elusimicrobiales bacterium]